MTGARPVPNLIADSKADNTAVAPPGATLHPIADAPNTSHHRRGPQPKDPGQSERTGRPPPPPPPPRIDFLIIN